MAKFVSLLRCFRTRGGAGLLAGALCLWVAGSAAADVRLSHLFSDNMVLQRGKPVPIWGWAQDGETVTVRFRDQTVTVQPKDGRWMARLQPLCAGGPDTLTVRGHNTITLTNVLVGEVWICSGQSNMEFPLRASYQARRDIEQASNPMIRLFTVPKKKADAPADDVEASWQLCAPETVPGFTAVGYYFGRSLQASLGIPVGLIHTSWGGSPAEVWMSEDVLSGDPEYRRDILGAYRAARAGYEEALKRWEAARTKAKEEGKPFKQHRPWAPWKPSELYNGMIAPLLPVAIRGAIWYQGESNADRAWQYRRLFADMIRNWRRDFGQGDFPFLAVQLAPWDANRHRPLEEITAQPTESSWAELREAQVLATQILPNVGLAVITDVGNKDDIHPNRKKPVGTRLALAAQVIAYHQKVAGLSPFYRAVRFENGRAIVSFDNAEGGLRADGEPITGFAIAGKDRKFVWARARIVGNEVEVWSDAVPEPVAVRFGWADYPVVNLRGANGLPVSPFRTDDWPVTTQPKAKQ
jgi:sialate O-acetylesterase